MAPRAPRNSRHGLRPRIITERITSDRSRAPPCTRTRPVDTSSTWYMPELTPDRLPPPRVLAPNAASNDHGPVMTPSSTPDSDSDGSVRPHPGASSPTVVHGPRKLLQEFTIALRSAHHEPFTAWTQGELDDGQAQERQGCQAHLQDYCPLPPEACRGSQAGMEGLSAT